jgi:hypothetical protein
MEFVVSSDLKMDEAEVSINPDIVCPTARMRRPRTELPRERLL